MPAQVTATSQGGSTNYAIEGKREEVMEAIADINRNYHPLGYGTWFHAPKERPDGTVVVYGSRANSCD